MVFIKQEVKDDEEKKKKFYFHHVKVLIIHYKVPLFMVKPAHLVIAGNFLTLSHE